MTNDRLGLLSVGRTLKTRQTARWTDEEWVRKNAKHLEPVPGVENTRRAYARRREDAAL